MSVDKFNRLTHLARNAAFALPSSMLVVGMLSAYAVPGNNKRMVPINAAPAKGKTASAKSKAASGSKPIASSVKVVAPVERSGEQIYRQLCSGCHGANGQGGKAFRRPLTGDRSVGQLARFIRMEMPPDAPERLPQKDALKVAEYIHDAFYSSLARERNKPARVELSRLTVRQYRNVITDLIGSFRSGEQPDARQGLAAKYFKAQPWRDVLVERVDPEIRFDYGTAGALPGQDDPYQFAMHWQGSVLAPETGEYEFIVHTGQGATLWLNDLKQPLIDAKVKSGDSTEHRASIFLLAGRRYPLRLEFFKGVQGVNDLKKLKEKPVQPASLRLEWKLPRRAAEVIPQRALSPAVTAPVFVATTPFPPDDRSVGYERGTAISKEWADATTEAALESTSYIMANLSDLAGVKDDAKDRDAKLREFCGKFVTRALRRPLSDEQSRFFIDRQFQSTPDVETAIKRVLLLTLTSPRFLYRETGAVEAATTPKAATATATTASTTSDVAASATGAIATSAATSSTTTPDAYNVASRLSFAMWDSLPDEELLKAAAEGKLATREQVMAQAQRMAADPRAWSKMKDFLLHWLKVDHNPELAKNPKRFPQFNEAVASDLRTSLELTLERIVWSDKSDFRELMLTNRFQMNGRLAAMYGVPLAPDEPFQMVSLDLGKRSGILTHPYILASFGYLDTSSPIHRGVLIARNFLGRSLRQPPAAFTPLEATLHPKLTTRQRVALQTKPSACSSCHSLINPLGFSLESYDAIGGLRDKENGMPIDASGGYQSPSGQEVRFQGPRDLARFLAQSEEVHTAFVERLFQNIVKQPVRAYGPRTHADMVATFKNNNYSIKQQMLEIATMTALHLPNAKSQSSKPANAKPSTQKPGSPKPETAKSATVAASGSAMTPGAVS